MTSPKMKLREVLSGRGESVIVSGAESTRARNQIMSKIAGKEEVINIV